MANVLHLNFLKYFAIFGIMQWYVEQTMEQPLHQHHEKQRCHHYYRLPHPHNGSQYESQYYNHHPHRHHHHPYQLPGRIRARPQRQCRHRRQQRHLLMPCSTKQSLRCQQIYTLLLILGVFLTTLYGLIYLPFHDTSIIPDLVSIIMFVIHFAAIIVILVETLLSYDKHFELLANHMQIQHLFRELLQTQLCVATIRRRQKWKYGFYIVSVYGCLLVIMVIVVLKDYYGFFWHALMMVLILRSRCLQMLILLDHIFYYLELLQLKLKALISCRMLGNYRYLDVNYQYLESYGYMDNLKMVYTEIYLLHQRFNDVFGLSLLALVIGISLDVVIHVYWSFLTLMALYKFYFLYITVATLVPLFIMIFMLCYAADGCEKQCNLILISLKHLLKPTLSCQLQADYNALLRDFIMQIIHNPIRISANEYFTINLRFLMEISANIVTYLVILLQFRKTSDAKAMQDDAISNDRVPKTSPDVTNARV